MTETTWAMDGAAKAMAKAYDKYDDQNTAVYEAQKAWPHVSTNDMVMMWKSINSYVSKDYEKTLRIIIAGGRKFKDYRLLCATLDHSLRDCSGYNITIISGAAPGADRLGERYARERGYEIDPHPAEWDKYGKRAGMVRNEFMAMSTGATHCFVFWDGVSPGSKDMIDQATNWKVPTKVINYVG